MTTEKPVSEKKAMKKKLIHNVIELAIWLILLWMCYGYIQSHPAEKISFFSWYKVIYQQTEIFFQNIFGKNGDLIKEKYDLESYYQVLITLSEEKSCVEPELIEDLHNTYQKLLDEPKNNLEQSLSYYINKQYDFDSQLRKECDNWENDIIENMNEDMEENIIEENNWENENFNLEEKTED